MESMKLLRGFGRYNAWANQNIYAVCADIPDSERKRDLGAFFLSIHGTLNHLLLTDRLWIGRLVGVDFPMASLRDELYGDFNELARERAITDAQWSRLLDGYSSPDLSKDLTYTSVSTGLSRSY